MSRVVDEAFRVERTEVRGWGTPQPLRAVEHTPPFPVDVLPRWIGDFVTSTAEATQVPTDMAGMLALAALAAACGGTLKVQVRDGWVEPSNLYVCAIALPGERKSAAVRKVTAPLYAYERELLAATHGEIIERGTVRRTLEQLAGFLERQASKGNAAERAAKTGEAIEARRKAEEVEVPPEPQLLADDATPEALASLIADQGGRIAIVSAEGGVFDLMAGRYSSGSYPNLDVYLKGHAGDDLRVNRKGRKAERVAEPALTVGVAVQPAVIEAIADRPGFRGRGLLARFLYTFPDSRLGFRRIAAPPVPPAVAATYRERMADLASIMHDAQPFTIELSGDAEAAMRGFEAELEPRLGPAGDLAAMSDWAGKLAGAAARIAGLLHAAVHLDDGLGAAPIEADTMRAAIRLARYLVPHARRVFDHMGADPRMAVARRVRAWIAAKGADEFSKRDVQTELRFPRADDVDAPLRVLTEYGYIRPLPAERRAGPGRPPSPRFEAHPRIAEFAAVSAETAQTLSAESADFAATDTGEGGGE